MMSAAGYKKVFSTRNYEVHHQVEGIAHAVHWPAYLHAIQVIGDVAQQCP